MEFGKGVVIFASGLLVGALGALWYGEAKSEKVLEEELNRAYDLYNKKLAEIQGVSEEKTEAEEQKESKDDKNKPSVTISTDSALTENKAYTSEKTEYNKLVKRSLDASDISTSLTHDVEFSDPYEIADSEFKTIASYKVEELRFYADYILTDDDDNKIETPRGLLGDEILSKLRKLISAGEDAGHDVLYVQDDRLRVYYEVLLDYNKYSELYRKR